MSINTNNKFYVKILRITVPSIYEQYLSTIHPDAFTNTNEHVRVFGTLNTNLSETIFDNILTKFVNIIRISMLNDSVQRIPSYAFIQPKLERLWFGIENGIAKQPLKSIERHAFYYLPSLRFLRIISDHLNQFDKYSFALEKRWDPKCNQLEITLGGND